VKETNEQIEKLRSAAPDGKLNDEQKAEEKALLDKVETNRKEQEELLGHYAGGHPVIKQAIDIALLGNGLLKGRALSDFIRRSFEMLK
ncbi:MAG: molecular chaperone HtpG, partial [Duncaniella sp.]|nr:molecular chaperone HtpG [Duncaniella sp.]